METKVSLPQHRGKECWGCISSETWHHADSRGTSPQTSLQRTKKEMSPSLLPGVLPPIGSTGAGRSTDMSFRRARTSPQDMSSSTVLLNTSWKSAISHEKKLEVVSPSPPQWREALHTVCNTSKYLFQTKYFPHEASQPKTWRKP